MTDPRPGSAGLLLALGRAAGRRLPREAGLAAPAFEELATRFRVTIATARYPALQCELDEQLGSAQARATP